MTHHWDEFSKLLATPVRRRESLFRLGALAAGAVLSPLGIAVAAGRTDPCKAFCKCQNRKAQNQCLNACRACNQDPRRLAGSCGGYFCCGPGQFSCGSYCADLAHDPDNCGACGFQCAPPGINEYGACIDGECYYECADGAVYCGETCTYLESDPYNCGACGNVCGGSTPYCNQGVCSECAPYLTLCGGTCVYLLEDPDNCGACGNVCPTGTSCLGGICQDDNPAFCPEGYTLCNGVCTDTYNDPFNCGGCGIECPPDAACIASTCIFGGGGW